MPFYQSTDREVKQISPGITVATFWGEKMLISVVYLEAHAIMPTHNHPHEQICYVLEGELEFDLGGEKRTVHPGDIVVIPENVDHTVTVGSVQSKVVDTFSPVREDLKY